MSNSEKRAYDFSAVLAVEAFFLILFFFLPLEPFFRGHGADSEWVRAYYAVVGLLCLATTVLRSLNHRWAYPWTFVTCSLLLFVLVVGTVPAVIWFISYRRSDRAHYLAERHG